MPFLRSLSGGVRRRRGLVGLASASLLLAVMLGGVAYAAISEFDPPSGAVTPGSSTSTDFTLTPPTVLGLDGVSCLLATVSPNPGQFTVVFEGLGGGALPPNCALGETPVEMTVTAQPSATPGDHAVTIQETTTGGTLIGSAIWPFTVGATTTTSSTSSTTTTSTPAGTSTTTSSSTTSQTTGTTQTTTSGGGGSDPGGDGPESSDGGGTDDDGSAADIPGDPGQQERNGYVAIAISEAMREGLDGRGFDGVTDGILSPLVIGEILLRALTGTAAAFSIPLLLVTSIGLCLVWRARRVVDDGELGSSARDHL